MNLTYPSDLSLIERHPAWMQFNFFDRKSPKESTPKDKINLYMPEAVSQPSTVSWDTERMGMAGNVVAQAGAAFNGADGLLGGIKAAGSAVNTSTDGIGELLTARGLANAGAAAVGLLGGQATAEGLMGTVAGKIPNPYLTMVFRGIDFRNFSFVFKFYPHDIGECDIIDNIIKTFRANALPEYEAGMSMLGYPAECEIQYQWMQKENPWMHRFKRSVCTAVDVDYTSTGMFSVMRNGFPTCITMATKWSEIELVTRKDIFRNGTDGGY